MKFSIAAAVVLAALPATGCNGNSGPSTKFNPPNTQFAGELGIATPPPVTEDQAKAIAAQAAGGTALSATQESEGGVVFYEVIVQTSAGNKEVEVRSTDGGVVEIESADND